MLPVHESLPLPHLWPAHMPMATDAAPAKMPRTATNPWSMEYVWSSMAVNT
jgi:hypothetical protein